MPPRSNEQKETAEKVEKKEGTPVDKKEGTPVTPPVTPPSEKEGEGAKTAEELKIEKEAREAAEAENKRKDEEIAELNRKLKEKEEQDAQTAAAQAGTHPVVQAQAKKAKLTKVKFVKDHSFQTGTVKHNCSKDDVLEVEPHLANKLVARQIAYILG